MLELVDLGGVACDPRVEEAVEDGEVEVNVGEEELDRGKLVVERGVVEELRAVGEGREEERRREELDEEVEDPCDGSRGGRRS